LYIYIYIYVCVCVCVCVKHFGMTLKKIFYYVIKTLRTLLESQLMFTIISHFVKECTQRFYYMLQ